MDRTSGKTSVLLFVVSVFAQFIALEFRYLINRIFIPERDPERRKDK